MVAHQILVLPVKVRVLVRQQPSDYSEGFFIFMPMIRFHKILVFSLFAATTACTDNLSIDMAQYEHDHHQIRISKVLNISDIEPLKAADSLVWCLAEYNKLKEQLIAIQQLYIDSISNGIDDALLRNSSEKDELIKKAINHGIKSMERKRERALQIIDAYTNHPENTSLNPLVCKIAHYKQKSDSIIGFVQRCTFIGQQGLLPEETFKRTYLLSADRQNIIGEINEP